MKKFLTMISMLTIMAVQAQAYKGKEDVKGQVGATLQNGGTGIRVSTDFGMGENISLGLTAGYMLNADPIATANPKFEDRIDLKGRFNAHIGNVLQLEEKMDVYAGLNLGLRNFGGHLGFRYFFTDGFGVYTESEFPLATYKKDPIDFQKYNNQFVFHIGASFNF